MTALRAPSEEDVQVARSAFSLLEAAVTASAPPSAVAPSGKGRAGSSDCLQMLRWCVGSIQGVADLLLLHMQQQERCKLLEEQGVWEDVAGSVSSSCQMYVQQFLPQMLRIHKVENALLERRRENPPHKQSTQDEESTFRDMISLARQLQAIELAFIDRLLEINLKAAPCCVTALRDILERCLLGVGEETPDERGGREPLLEEILSVLKRRAAASLLPVAAAAAALSGGGVAAVSVSFLCRIGKACGCLLGKEASLRLRLACVNRTSSAALPLESLGFRRSASCGSWCTALLSSCTRSCRCERKLWRRQQPTGLRRRPLTPLKEGPICRALALLAACGSAWL